MVEISLKVLDYDFLQIIFLGYWLVRLCSVLEKIGQIIPDYVCQGPTEVYFISRETIGHSHEKCPVSPYKSSKSCK